MPGPSARLGRAQLLVCAATVAVMITAAGCSATVAGSTSSGYGQSQSATIPAADGPGVTADTITISWGRSLPPTTDQKPDDVQKLKTAWQAVVDTFNQQGGINGRRIQIAANDPGTALVAQRNEAFVSSNFLPVPDPTNGKAACDAYAGAPIFALFAAHLVSKPYGTAAAAACLNAQGHPIIGTDAWTEDDYRRAPATAGMGTADGRFINSVVAAGKDSGMFGTPAKTALITDSAAPTDTLNTVYLPALAKAGVVDPQVYPVAVTLDQAGQLNLVVKLKSAGIQQVIIVSPDKQFSFSMAMTLIPAFQQQRFNPKILSINGINYAVLGDAENIDNLIAYESLVNRDALQLTSAQAATPAGKLHDRVTKAHPELQRYVDLDLCDALELLKAALSASGSKYINAQAFAAGLDKLGTTYQSPLLLATSFGPNRHDGAAGIVRLTYSATCKCGRPGKVLQF